MKNKHDHENHKHKKIFFSPPFPCMVTKQSQNVYVVLISTDLSQTRKLKTLLSLFSILSLTSQYSILSQRTMTPDTLRGRAVHYHWKQLSQQATQVNVYLPPQPLVGFNLGCVSNKTQFKDLTDLDSWKYSKIYLRETVWVMYKLLFFFF